MPLVIPNQFGYVVAVGALSSIVPVVLGAQVNGARKRANVPYPHMYATQAECAEDKSKLIFNCYQRAHHNFLENYPQFLFLLGVSGLQYPEIAAGAGVTWIIGRLLYAFNYQTGDPSKRNGGIAGIHALGLLTLMGLGITTGVKLSIAAIQG
ncbi:UNVERIFIED_CONTAM: Microsomal glutathione S-transferase 3 [Siphonaria sp. JEL0065]|nr:Microsomal glutathione S-transferase 3 [Siphonaria sp. JEL0065]